MRTSLKRIALAIAAISALAPAMATSSTGGKGPTEWYEPTVENRPFVRWWWHGSAVDPEGLTFNLEQFARQGLGGVEITPIFGVKGNEANDIPYLSEKWMDMLRHVINESARLGLQVDMNNGTGWPFGGPEVTTDESARKQIVETWDLKGGEKLKSKVVPTDARQRPVATIEKIMAVSGGKRIDVTDRLKKDTTLNWKAPKGQDWKIYALFAGRTFQKVKRAAPGGEGYVVNHYDSVAVKKYLDRFDRAFAGREELFPNTFFNDSYEVYGSDWTEGLFDEFYKDHGYKLEYYLPEFAATQGHDELRGRLVRDYRYTLARLLKENFTEVWTRWAHSHGSRIRNQSHGSPANIIDLYAMVDIPECESFGRSDLNIPGLHPTGPSRPSDADPAVLKFASSAAHIAGKPLTSAETLTWLTEHFHTSLSLCKPEIDQMLASGVNHIFFHGAPYSPKGVAFPGWLFYASINMSPTNSFWESADGLFDYITRAQAFLSAGKPDNDVLLYFPIDDLWQRQDGIYMMFDIHSMDKKMPDVKETVGKIMKAGYDMDYLSDALIDSLTVASDGSIISRGGNTYKAIIVPPVNFMPPTTLAALRDIHSKGGKVIFTGKLPSDVPGMGTLDERRAELAAASAGLPTPVATIEEALLKVGAAPEPLRKEGINMLRRRNEAGGWNYFLALLDDHPVNGWVTLAVPSGSVMIFDPMTGKKGKAVSRTNSDGLTDVMLQLQPGQSVMLKTFPNDVEETAWAYYEPAAEPLTIDKGWSLSFIESEPAIEGTFAIDTLTDWTRLPLPEASVNSGKARYTVEFNLPEGVAADEWVLDLGDVRESADVFVNGELAATAWSVPFTVEIGRFLKPGANMLEIDVTNLQANRIADYDRRGVEWKIFKDANVASVTNARKVDFGEWPVVPSGLNGDVRLIPMKIKN